MSSYIFFYATNWVFQIAFVNNNPYLENPILFLWHLVFISIWAQKLNSPSLAKFLSARQNICRFDLAIFRDILLTLIDANKFQFRCIFHYGLLSLSPRLTLIRFKGHKIFFQGRKLIKRVPLVELLDALIFFFSQQPTNYQLPNDKFQFLVYY